VSLTIASECNQAALNGITALLDGGNFQLRSSTTPLADLSFQTSGGAFGTATNAAPSVATSNTIGSDTSPVAGTIDNFQLQTAGGSARISGTVGVGSGSGDLEVSDNVIPADATEVTCTGGLQLSLLLT
jgi:hypothetical protein